MRLIDVHCHLDNKFYDDVDTVIKRAEKHDMIVIPAGIDPQTNREVLSLQQRFPDTIYPALGIYPPDALKNEGHGNGMSLEDVEQEIAFIKENKDSIVAIGEVGMDAKTGTQPDTQEKIFRKMIELAIELHVPLVVHSRKAEERVIDILEEYDYQKVIMHCFGGNRTLQRRIRKNKWYFSIPCHIVRDDHFQRIVEETPLYMILTETDAPFLSPVKGQTNEPVNVMYTVEHIAKQRNMDKVDVMNLIWRNAEQLFEF